MTNEEENHEKSTARSNKDDKAARKKRREYFKHELEKLKEELEKCSTEIEKKKPEEKEFSPSIFNNLEPYTSLKNVEVLFIKKDKSPYKARMTSISLCDPEVSHEYDMTDEDRKIKEKERRKRQGLKCEDESNTARSTSRKSDRKKNDKKRPAKEGSTHLPKYPDPLKEDEDLWRRNNLDFNDVPWLRREINEQYTSNSKSREDHDYQRTRQDYYRMELDRLDEVDESSRKNLVKTYRAYLMNTPGSKKALIDCIKQTQHELKEAERKESENENKEDKEKETDNNDAVKE